MSDHPLVTLLRQIMASSLSVQERMVMVAIATHANWSDGGGAYMHVATLAREAGLSSRQTYQYLRQLECDPEMAARGECMGGRGCEHRGLVVCTAPRRQGYPAVYAIRLEEFAQQAHFPEVGGLAACDECALPAVAKGKCDTHYRRTLRASKRAEPATSRLDHGPFDHLIRRA